ncbi:MAG: Ig-like domain-containing protein, partial [Planctomycetota bacterium]
ATTATLPADGSHYAAPTDGWVGDDTFTDAATDGIDESPPATVTIGVMNFAPEVFDDGPYVAVYQTERVVAAADGVLENDWDPEGDDITVTVIDQPDRGTVILNATDGSFRYTPSAGYTGPDPFTYRGNDGFDDSLWDATVSIDVVRPVPDIDTDSDNNGMIDGTQYEDDEEMKDPGRLVYYNADDDNGNGVQDRLDPGPLVDGTGQPVNDDDLKPATLAIDPLGADLSGFSLQLATGANTKLFKTQDKQSLAMSYTIGTDQIPAEIYVEGYDYGQSQVDWILKNPAGVEVNRDTVKFTVVRVNLTAYRPITEQAYGAPFPRTEIPWQEEDTPGAGIRRNGDDDNGNGTPDCAATETSVANENDLIEVEVFSRPVSSPGIGYRIERSTPAIKVWGSSTKGNLYLDSDVPVPMAGGDYSMWVEYDPGSSQGSDLIYGVWDTTHNQRVFNDSVHLKPFSSVVIAFGGNDRDPLYAGSGTFLIAQDLYDEGYDVHAFNEEDVDAWNRPPHHEVVSAIDERGVAQVAVLGYSQGGGATYVLSTQLAQDPPTADWELAFTAYIDAVRHDGWNPEVRRPLGPGPTYHLNYWQHTPTGPLNLRGNVGENDNFELDVNTVPWGATLDHYTIDNDPTVITRIEHGSAAPAPEGPHDGLYDRVTR